MRFLNGKSLQTQLVVLGTVAVTIMSAAAAIVVATTWMQSGPQRSDALEAITLRFIATLICAGLVSLALMAFGIRRLLHPLHELRQSFVDAAEGKPTDREPQPASWDLISIRDAYRQLMHRMQDVQLEHEDAERVLGERTSTVNHLLEFSQTIQGAGKPDQIFAALLHYLRTELGLAGVAIIANELHAMPPIQLRACWPDDLLNDNTPITEMDATLCPCLRQNLPKCFREDGSPVRCAVDASLNLSPAHPAFCIPFTIGRKTQILVHMLMPMHRAWSEEAKQLAQTYVNSAHSSLIMLNMLSDAEQQSMTDGLTGLYNRRSLDQLLQREVALSERHGTPLSIVMIDMDKFKEINDSHGHAAGDHMLKAFADCVRITLRKTDLAFRYGGDEFVIALPQTGVTQAQQVVSKLKQAFTAVDFSSAIANLEHQPTLSIGVAERVKGDGLLTLPQLLAAADTALYEAKSANRNCVRVYQPTRAA